MGEFNFREWKDVFSQFVDYDGFICFKKNEMVLKNSFLASKKVTIKQKCNLEKKFRDPKPRPVINLLLPKWKDYDDYVDFFVKEGGQWKTYDKGQLGGLLYHLDDYLSYYRDELTKLQIEDVEEDIQYVKLLSRKK
jgi:hypothetical protein